MCGIAGIVAKNSKQYERGIKRMTFELTHRGPDEGGLEFFDSCVLGHRRLSIIDLKTGHQPMLSFDKQKVVIFNGEIYGYQEIKKTLSDYKFQTTSDTEIILALYDKYGDEFVKYLSGMFAFALWDDKEKKLICARDRFGEKPFYYALGKNGEFIFASEIKAILVSGLIRPKLNKKSLVHYLQRLYVHPYSTIYENIYVLPPAHKLIYQNKKITISRYWQMPEINNLITLDEAVGEFKKLLNQAVKRQLISDVPVGAFLSGGLDSSTIVALASQYKKNLNTFSFGFGEWINELPFALEIAKKYKTNHIELTPEKVDMGELLIKMQEVYDEPFGDSSNIPTYLLAKTARQYTKVVLTGDGGDEMLGGYGWYKPFLEQEKFLIDSFLRTKLVWFIAKVLTKLPISNKNYFLYRHLGAKFNKFDYVIEAHLSQNIIFNNKEIKTLGLEIKNKNEFYKPNWTLTNDLSDAMRFDVENYMAGDILTKVDRASMANGLELRAPFLDVDFTSFCLSLPHQLKITKETDKLILRKAFGNLWTDSIRKRQKQGFGGPVDKWLKEDKSINDLRQNYLNNPKRKIFNIISFKNTGEIIKKNNYKTWTLLVLSIWMEKHDFDL